MTTTALDLGYNPIINIMSPIIKAMPGMKEATRMTYRCKVEAWLVVPEANAATIPMRARSAVRRTTL